MYNMKRISISTYFVQIKYILLNFFSNMYLHDINVHYIHVHDIYKYISSRILSCVRGCVAHFSSKQLCFMLRKMSANIPMHFIGATAFYGRPHRLYTVQCTGPLHFHYVRLLPTHNPLRIIISIENCSSHYNY